MVNYFGDIDVSTSKKDIFGKDYEEILKEKKDFKDEENSYEAVIVTVTDVALLEFLTREHPGVYEEFKRERIEFSKDPDYYNKKNSKKNKLR